MWASAVMLLFIETSGSKYADILHLKSSALNFFMIYRYKYTLIVLSVFI